MEHRALLQEIVQSVVLERAQSNKFGTLSHVQGLEKSLDALIKLRNAQPRRTKSRYIFSRVVDEMRQQIRSSRTYGIRKGLIDPEAV